MKTQYETIDYFVDCENECDVKTRYRSLAKNYHPDLGGCKATMQEINLQYEKVLEKIYQKLGKSITEIELLLSRYESLRKAIESISFLEDITIEICGFWIWVYGNTKEHKDKLKTSGYFWAHNKKAWYWREEANKKYSNKPMEMEKIRMNYGSLTYKSNERIKLG